VERSGRARKREKKKRTATRGRDAWTDENLTTSGEGGIEEEGGGCEKGGLEKGGGAGNWEKDASSKLHDIERFWGNPSKKALKGGGKFHGSGGGPMGNA